MLQWTKKREEQDVEAMRTARWFVYYGGVIVAHSVVLGYVSVLLLLSLSLCERDFHLFNFINPHTAKHN